MKELNEQEQKAIGGGASTAPKLSSSKKGNKYVFTVTGCERIKSFKINTNSSIYRYRELSSCAYELSTKDGKNHNKSITVTIAAMTKKTREIVTMKKTVKL